MGEYAEMMMMMNGTCCERCGEFLGLDSFPGYCSPECAADSGASDVYDAMDDADAKPHKCHCGKAFGTAGGLRAHQDANHPPGKVNCPGY